MATHMATYMKYSKIDCFKFQKKKNQKFKIKVFSWNFLIDNFKKDY